MSHDIEKVTARLIKKLQAVGEDFTAKAIKPALRAGGNKAAAEIRKRIPKPKTPGHDNKATKKAVGFRVTSSKRALKSGQAEGKVGFGVGKKRGSCPPHAHLQLLGTKERTRKKIGGKFSHVTDPEKLKTGRHDGSPAVAEGVSAAGTKINEAISKSLEKSLKKSAEKVKRI